VDFFVEIFKATKIAGNSDGYVHMLMLQVERDKANNHKSGINDLKNLNQMFTLFKQHESKVLQQQQQQQQQTQGIKMEQVEPIIEQDMDQNSQPFMFNENTLSPDTALQF
jgi:hypothetical protein